METVSKAQTFHRILIFLFLTMAGRLSILYGVTRCHVLRRIQRVCKEAAGCLRSVFLI